MGQGAQMFLSSSSDFYDISVCQSKWNKIFKNQFAKASFSQGFPSIEESNTSTAVFYRHLKKNSYSATVYLFFLYPDTLLGGVGKSVWQHKTQYLILRNTFPQQGENMNIHWKKMKKYRTASEFGGRLFGIVDGQRDSREGGIMRAALWLRWILKCGWDFDWKEETVL